MTSAAVSLLLFAVQLIGFAQDPALSPQLQATALQAAQISVVIAQLPEAPAELVGAVQLLDEKIVAVAAQQRAQGPIQSGVTQPFGSTDGTTSGTVQPTSMPTQPSQPAPEPKLIAAVMFHSQPDPANNLPHGEYAFKVSFVDEKGHYVRDHEITMSAPDNLFTGSGDLKKKPNATVGNDNLWYATFGYAPTAPGKKTVVFSANGIQTSLEVDVQ